MLNRAQSRITLYAYLAILVGVLITVIVLDINLLGDTLRDIMALRLRKRQ